MDPSLIRKLKLIKDREFASMQIFDRQLENLFGTELSARQKDIIIAYVEKGVVPLHNKQTRGQFREGKSSSVASLNFIQHYDNLKKIHIFNRSVVELKEMKRNLVNLFHLCVPS